MNGNATLLFVSTAGGKIKKRLSQTIRCVCFQFEGKTTKEIMEIKKSVAKVQWSLINPSGISNPFDGTPFLCVGTIIYHCHQGNDVDVKTKQKRQEERDQKEVN